MKCLILKSPSAHAEDIGETLTRPSALMVEISATGVPKYKMAG